MPFYPKLDKITQSLKTKQKKTVGTKKERNRK